MKDEQFERLVKEGLQAIPQKALALLDNVDVVIEEDLSQEKREELELEENETLLGLYEGVPRTKRGPNYSAVLPDKISIFKKPILEEAQDSEKIKELVRDTVWHEIAHHFGMDEAEVTKAKRKRKPNH